MGSSVHDYKYAVQVKSRFELFAKEDYNVEDTSLVAKSRADKRERRTSGKAKSEVSEKVDTKETGLQKEGRNDTKKSDQKSAEAPKKDHSQRGKASSQGRLDRHSGSDKTGIKAVMKKDGYGTGNWGTIEDELEAQTEEVNIDQPVEDKEPAEPEASQEPVEEQPKTYTLKEYREMKKKANVVLASNQKTRRPNDGKNVFSNMTVLHEAQPVESKVEVILDDPKDTTNEEDKPVFFDIRRGGTGPSGRPFQRGGQRGARGGRGGQRSDQPIDRKPLESHETVSVDGNEAVPEESGEKEVRQHVTERRGRGRGVEGDRPFRGRGRGGRGGFSADRGGRGGFSTDRGGRGGFSDDRGGRGGFAGERGGRGGFSTDRGGRGGFSSDRGGRGRGGVAPAGDRPGFRGVNRGTPRGGERGGNRGTPRGGFSTGERGGRPEGGRGGFRRGRGGGVEHPHEGGFRGANHNQRPAPVMDSETEFPALK